MGESLYGWLEKAQVRLLSFDKVSELGKISCPVSHECGACALIDLSASAQRAIKLSRLRMLLAPVLEGQKPAFEIEFNQSAAPEGYRNRIRLQVKADGSVGFFNERKDPDCQVLSPALRESLHQLMKLAHGLKSLFSRVSHLELREPDLDRRASIFLSLVEGGEGGTRAALQSALGADFLLGFEGQSVESQRYAIVPNVHARVPLGGFMQVNQVVNRALVSQVVDGALKRNVTRAADLYCGAGNFALPLADAGVQTVGVEVNSNAVHALRKAAAQQGLEGQWFCESVPEWAGLAGAEGGRFELLVLDPPRAGLGAFIDALLSLSPNYIALCSCRPESLVRDLCALQDSGFIVESAELFDMFEHTHSVETLVWLSRR